MFQPKPIMKLAHSFISLRLASLPIVLAALAGSAGQEFSEEFHQTLPLDPQGGIHLENVNGNVRISTWYRAEVKIDAVKRAKKQEHLAMVKIDVEAKAHRIGIKTKYPDPKSFRKTNVSVSVDYTLTVPKQCDLDGIGTVNGSVRANFARVKQPVSLKSVNGGVTIALPPEANADVSASTVNGGIQSDFPLQVNKLFSSGHHLDCKLGGGGPALNISTVNGGIQFDRL